MEELKTNDIVVCKPGFNTTDSGYLKGGIGYIEGQILKISSFTSSGNIVWSKNQERGVWKQAVRKATEREILEFTNKGISNISEMPKEEIINNYNIW